MSRILETINSPADVKALNISELETLAEEIRQELISTLAKTGGHLGPNLGVVELTLAMHYVFDTPKDNFVFDVSHQAYVHKMLTGRRDRLDTIRQPGGLNGFMLRTESEHDCYGAGHAGTALSAALGMASGRDQLGGDEHVVALCGDAAFTCGITYEAVNNVAETTKKLIVILNDNEWSIDKNVGAIANYFNKIVTNDNYKSLHDQAEWFLKKIAGQTAVTLAEKVEEAVKGLVSGRATYSKSGETDWRVPSLIFDELGLTYYGPFDGHDIRSLIDTFEFMKHLDHPVLMHAITQKGKGFDLARAKQKKYHGIGPGTYDPNDKCEITTTSNPTYSEVFANTMVKLADMNSKVTAITGAMPNGTKLDIFQPKHPDKYFDVGIAEEHAVLFAAGQATKGLKPFCAIYSTFLQRAYDQIVHDVALQNLNVTFCMDRGSLSGDDGPTHHGLFDIAYMRSIPNMKHAVPKDEDELADLLYTALHNNDGPMAIRYPRGVGPGTPVKENPALIPVGKSEVLKHGTQVAIFALGLMIPKAMEAAEQLEAKGYSCAVINGRWTKPIDTGTLEFFARAADVVVTMEDHVKMGGYGSAILEELSDLGISTPVVRIGWPDKFIDHGKPPQLMEEHGLTAEAAVEQTLAILDGSAAKAAAKPAPETVDAAS